MNETFKEIIAFLTTFLLLITLAWIGVFGMYQMMAWNDNNAEQHKHQQQQQELKECYQKTNDLDWCLEKIIK